MMNRFYIRFFDIVLAAAGIVMLMPLFVVVGILIKTGSRGGVFFRQNRVGQHGKDFSLFKFRTMYEQSDKKGLITVGAKDPRITSIGRFLRKYKIDELPQLINIIKGEMSFVGPRPEVRKYVNLYNSEQKRVLEVKPGITDYASIKYVNENDILGKVEDPERYYIDVLMPEKLKLNLSYAENRNILNYFRIIVKTLFSIAGD